MPLTDNEHEAWVTDDDQEEPWEGERRNASLSSPYYLRFPSSLRNEVVFWGNSSGHITPLNFIFQIFVA